jgi:hypothetical protein
MNMSFDESGFGPTSCPNAKPDPGAAGELADDVDAGVIPPTELFALAEALVVELQGMPRPELAAELDGENSPGVFDPGGWSAALELDSRPPAPSEPRFSCRLLAYGASGPIMGCVDGWDAPDEELGLLDAVPAPFDGESPSDIWPPRPGSPAVEPAPPVEGTITPF